MSPLKLNTDAVPTALANPATLALTLSFIIESLVEPSVLYGDHDNDAVDPVALITYLEHEFHVDMPPAVENRLQAVMLLRTTAAFESDPRAFIAIALALYDGYLGDLPTGVLEDLNIGEALWAVFESACVDPRMNALSAEVENYVMALAAEPAEADDTTGEPVDELGDVARRMDVLQHQLLELGVPAHVIDDVFRRGTTALQHAQTT